MKKLAILFIIISVIGLIAGGVLAVMDFDIENFVLHAELRDEDFTEVSLTLEDTPKKITVDVAWLDVIFTQSTEETVSFTYYNAEDISEITHSVNAEGTLTISAEYKRHFGWINYLCSKEKKQVLVRIPTSFAGGLDLSSTAGDVEMTVSGTYESVKVKSTSGDTVVKNITAQALSARSTSGNVVAESVRIEGNISLQSTSGTVKLRDAAGKDISLISTSGGVTAENIDTQGKLSLDSTSGDATVSNVTINELSLKSTSGDAKGTKIDAKKIYCRTSSGSISLELKGSESDYGFELKTSSGSVKLGGTGYGRKKETNGAIEVYAQASSGDVSIRFY